MRRIADRIEDQSHDHWHEFAVILASANVVVALLLYGRAITDGYPGTPRLLALAVALASTMAVILAYYSIQIGNLLVFGPLRLGGVLTSFLVAATQLALFLWPMHVLGSTWRRGASEVNGLRHWLLFFAAFALAAVLASWHEMAVRREATSITPLVMAYERGQRFDRISALSTGVWASAWWVLTFLWPVPALAIGIAGVVIGSSSGLMSQAKLARRVQTELRS
jgi:hypothetical protein